MFKIQSGSVIDSQRLKSQSKRKVQLKRQPQDFYRVSFES